MVLKYERPGSFRSWPQQGDSRHARSPRLCREALRRLRGTLPAAGHRGRRDATPLQFINEAQAILDWQLEHPGEDFIERHTPESLRASALERHYGQYDD